MAIVISDDNDDDDESEFEPDPWLGLLLNTSAGQSTRRSRSRSPPSRAEFRRWFSLDSNLETQRNHPAAPQDLVENENDDLCLSQSCEFSEPVLQKMLRSALLEAANRSLPIMFEYVRNPSCRDTLETLIGSGHYVGFFYIGATQNPVRRWLGGWSERENKPMKGHCEKWEYMYMIGLEKEARNLEKRLIEWALLRWPDQCTNRAPDARGQCAGPNWIYVCV